MKQSLYLGKDYFDSSRKTVISSFKGLRYDIIKKDIRLEKLINDKKQVRYISDTLWYEIFKDFRVGTFKFLNVFKSSGLSNKIILLPSVFAPLRLDLEIYSLYNKYEQIYLANRLKEEFNVESILQPDETTCETKKGIYTLDQYHREAPDPHHPSDLYFQLLLDIISKKFCK